MAIDYEFSDGTALVTIDDGKANALSSDVLGQIGAALDRAEADGAVSIITGNERLFSAGFDLKELAAGTDSARALVKRGADLCLRLLQFPLPVVCACNGHAYPMGAFILMSSDYRLGATGSYHLGMNEVRIGLTVPAFAVELARGRLHPAYFNRTAVTGELFGPEDAVRAGILDELVPADALLSSACAKAEDLKSMGLQHHVETKRLVRGPWIEAVEAGVTREL